MQVFEPILDDGFGNRLGDSSHLAGLGAVQAFERRLASEYGMRYALAMPSATTGLLALGLALGLRGAEFVTTPLTWGGSLGSWLAIGARPRFADVDRDTLTLDPSLLATGRSRRTRAILAVDLFGQPCDDEALRRVADEAGAWLVVDGAQSFGARRAGRASGRFAHALVLSFTAGKPLDVGEGGAVLTDDPEIYAKLVWHSQHPERQKLELGLGATNEFAINGRMAPAIAEQALARVDASLATVAARRAAVDVVREQLVAAGLINTPDVGPCEPSWFRLTARWVGRQDPEAVVRVLALRDIPSEVLPFPVRPVPLQPAFQATTGRPRGRWAVARQEAAARCWIRLTEEACWWTRRGSRVIPVSVS